MNERTIVGVVVGVLVLGVVAAATKSTDAVFVVAAFAFFGISVAYAEWCERL